MDKGTKCPTCEKEVSWKPFVGSTLGKDFEHLSKEHKEVPVVTIPSCDWCEGENQDASTFCEDCLTLYCDRCLASLHPLRGPFEHHKLVPAEKVPTSRKLFIEYFQEQLMRYRLKGGRATENEPCGSSFPDKRQQGGETTTAVDKADPSVSICEDHIVTPTLFCDTCNMTICTDARCSSRHNDHETLPIWKAYNRSREPVDGLLESLTARLIGLKQFQINVAQLRIDIETTMLEEKGRVETFYVDTAKILHFQRISAVDDIALKGADFMLKHVIMSNVANKWVEEMDSVMLYAAELLLGDPAVFLREATALDLRIERLIEKTNDTLDLNSSPTNGSASSDPTGNKSQTTTLADSSGEVDNRSDQKANIGEKIKRLSKILASLKQIQKEMASSKIDLQETTSAKTNSELESYDDQFEALRDSDESQARIIEKKWLDFSVVTSTLSDVVDGWVEKMESAIAESVQLFAGDQTVFLNKYEEHFNRIESIINRGDGELGKAWQEFKEVRQAVMFERKLKKVKIPQPTIPDSPSECNLM